MYYMLRLFQFPEADSHPIGEPAPRAASDLPRTDGVRHPQVHDHRYARGVLVRMW